MEPIFASLLRLPSSATLLDIHGALDSARSTAWHTLHLALKSMRELCLYSPLPMGGDGIMGGASLPAAHNASVVINASRVASSSIVDSGFAGAPMSTFARPSGAGVGSTAAGSVRAGAGAGAPLSRFMSLPPSARAPAAALAAALSFLANPAVGVSSALSLVRMRRQPPQQPHAGLLAGIPGGLGSPSSSASQTDAVAGTSYITTLLSGQQREPTEAHLSPVAAAAADAHHYPSFAVEGGRITADLGIVGAAATTSPKASLAGALSIGSGGVRASDFLAEASQDVGALALPVPSFSSSSSPSLSPASAPFSSGEVAVGSAQGLIDAVYAGVVGLLSSELQLQDELGEQHHHNSHHHNSQHQHSLFGAGVSSRAGAGEAVGSVLTAFAPQQLEAHRRRRLLGSLLAAVDRIAFEERKRLAYSLQRQSELHLCKCLPRFRITLLSIPSTLH